MHVSPAQHVITQFKGVRAAARALGRTPGTISNWRRPVSKKGNGGEIPSGIMRKIMEVAHLKKLDITPHDLVFGRNIKKAKKK